MPDAPVEQNLVRGSASTGVSSSQLEPDTEDAYHDLLEVAEELGIGWQLTSTRRTCDKQNALYAQGRKTPGNIVTGARGCRSWHVVGRAFDVLVDSSAIEDYRTLGAIWKEWGGVWGGDFSIGDFGHFEWHPGLSINEVCPNPDRCKDVGIQQRVEKSTLFETLAVAGAVFVGYFYWKSKLRA